MDLQIFIDTANRFPDFERKFTNDTLLGDRDKAVVQQYIPLCHTKNSQRTMGHLTCCEWYIVSHGTMQ